MSRVRVPSPAFCVLGRISTVALVFLGFRAVTTQSPESSQVPPVDSACRLRPEVSAPLSAPLSAPALSVPGARACSGVAFSVNAGSLGFFPSDSELCGAAGADVPPYCGLKLARGAPRIHTRAKAIDRFDRVSQQRRKVLFIGLLSSAGTRATCVTCPVLEGISAISRERTSGHRLCIFH